VPGVQLSTDDVFKGGADLLYREDDLTDPLGILGTSKLAGEQAVASTNWMRPLRSIADAVVHIARSLSRKRCSGSTFTHGREERDGTSEKELSR
jgi:hypothetical protein